MKYFKRIITTLFLLTGAFTVLGFLSTFVAGGCRGNGNYTYETAATIPVGQIVTFECVDILVNDKPFFGMNSGNEDVVYRENKNAWTLQGTDTTTGQYFQASGTINRTVKGYLIDFLPYTSTSAAALLVILGILKVQSLVNKKKAPTTNQTEKV